MSQVRVPLSFFLSAVTTHWLTFFFPHRAFCSGKPKERGKQRNSTLPKPTGMVRWLLPLPIVPTYYLCLFYASTIRTWEVPFMRKISHVPFIQYRTGKVSHVSLTYLAYVPLISLTYLTYHLSCEPISIQYLTYHLYDPYYTYLLCVRTIRTGEVSTVQPRFS